MHPEHMFEKIDLSKQIDKKEYKALMKDIEIRLGQLQREAKDKEVPVIVVFEGWDASGKGRIINELILPMNPRYFSVITMQEENEDEMRRPFLWRFWIKTPEKGDMAVFDRSWYRRIMDDAAEGNVKGKALETSYGEINSFERVLYEDGFIILKFFLHISKEEQKKRQERMEKNPATAWRIREADKRQNKKYDVYMQAMQRAIEETDTERAPWTIVECEDYRFGIIKTLMSFIEGMEAGLARIDRQRELVANAQMIRKMRSQSPDENPENGSILRVSGLKSSVIDKVDLSLSMDKQEYEKRIDKLQCKMRLLGNELYRAKIPVVIAYEGWDAAGKGGNIKRLAASLDPRGYDVVPISSPDDTEKNHHYLWRFWREMPKTGHIAIFDRSWYGRVLVERVEGYCSEAEWKRAYREINDMEEHIVNFGTVFLKYWIHIDRDEQLKRFKERESDPNKTWKISDEDWRNRYNWDSYKDAVDEMLFRTSTTFAPWTIVESNCKRYARVKVLEHTIEEIEKALKNV